jgi:hypothetical protein
MLYEVRERGLVVATYDRQSEALEHVKHLLARNPDSDAEIVTGSGAPAEPGATKQDREHYASKVGF